MNEKKMSANYICTHLGEENAADINFGAVAPPVYATSLHVFKKIEDHLNYDASSPDSPYIYGRCENPTVRLLQTKLAALEGADDAVCFGSGMGAISSAILHCVKQGGHIVAVRNAYGPARKFLDEYLVHYGVAVTYVDGDNTDDFLQAIRPNTAAFYLESPTSIAMQLQDLRAVVEIAKAKNIKTIIDNTWATPIYQSPIALGIDIVVHTMSKYIGGHSDIIGGVLCANAEITASVRTMERELLGGILGPFEAWLAVRGLRTLPERLKKSSHNAQTAALFLEAHKGVRRVLYPGVESYPQRQLALAQMSGTSGLLSFELDATPEQAITVVNSLKLFHKGVSWGGYESLVCLPMFNSSDEEAKLRGGSRNLVRIYTGMEETDELVEDLAQALDSIR